MFFLIILSILIAVLFSGFFSASEIAYFSLSEVKLKTLLKKKIGNAQYVSKLKSNPERLLTTILIYNNLVNIGTSAVVTYAMTQLYGSNGVGLATGLMTLVILIFGDIIPKSLATRYSGQISLKTSKILLLLQTLLFPVIWVFEKISKLPKRFLKKDLEDSQITVDDVVSMATISFDQGEILDYERDIITNVLNLDDTRVKRIMTPKSQMKIVDSELSLFEVVKSVNEQHYSRIPIYKGTKDQIIGFIFLRDILYIPKEEWITLKAKDIARKPLVVKDTDLLDKVYKLLLRNRTHLVIVEDKEKQVVGMLTLEDIIEEVLGEIYDETDPKE